VRFLFGLPFALLFLCAALLLSGAGVPAVPPSALATTALGGVSQIAATALMLAVMQQRAFVVAYAYIKTEPAIVGLLGVVFLGETIGPFGWAAVAVVTLGVLVASVDPRRIGLLLRERGMIAAGLASGGLFGLSAIAFRAAIGGLQGGFVVRSLTILVISLVIQTMLLGTWLLVRDRAALWGSIRHWRSSIGAGFLGALASAAWFCAFALAPAVHVRTLGLVEMPIAALLSGRVTGRRMARHELAGMGLVMIGVAMLIVGLVPGGSAG
jgi:drug/metabolite transporter (DMT)-like permease